MQVSRHMGFIRFAFFGILTLVFWTASTGSLFAQKKPGKNDSVEKLLKDIDNLYKDTESQITLRMYMLTDGWNSLRTADPSQDPSLRAYSFAPFGSLDPWFYFTAEYRFKPIRFLTLIVAANIMPESRNRAGAVTIYTHDQGVAQAHNNAYQDLQAEALVDIGPGEMTLSARYTYRVDSFRRVWMGNGATSFDRGGTGGGPTGWPLDPFYNAWETGNKEDSQDWTLNRLVVYLRNSKQLKLEPSVTVTGQYLKVDMPSYTNLNYDPWTFNATDDSSYGRTFPSYLPNKLTLTVDAKLTFRPIDTMTIVLGGTMTPTFPVETAVQLNTIINSLTTTGYLNLDLRLSPRLLWQNGFTLATYEYRYTYPYSTYRYADTQESPAWLGRYMGSEHDRWRTTFFSGFQYK